MCLSLPDYPAIFIVTLFPGKDQGQGSDMANIGHPSSEARLEKTVGKLNEPSNVRNRKESETALRKGGKSFLSLQKFHNQSSPVLSLN